MRIPLHIRRDTVIYQRAQRVFAALTAVVGSPATRTRFRDHIEAVLTEAGSAFCDFLYARANGKRAEAVRRWEEVQGLVEYELPMCLLRPVKGLTQRRSREKAAKAVVRIIAAEMPGYRRQTEAMYATFRRPTTGKGLPATKRCQSSKSIKRPEESCFQEFFPWVEGVIMATFSVQEVNDERKHTPSRTGIFKS